MDELVRQCRAAIAWVHHNAPSFDGDPNRIYVSGHSAGGHLVAMLMSTDWKAFGGLPVDVIKVDAASAVCTTSSRSVSRFPTRS
jgi:arylformamidase